MNLIAHRQMISQAVIRLSMEGLGGVARWSLICGFGAWFAAPWCKATETRFSAAEIFQRASERFARSQSWSYETASEDGRVVTKHAAKRAPDGTLIKREETWIMSGEDPAGGSGVPEIHVVIDREDGRWLLFPAIVTAIKVPDKREDSEAVRSGDMQTHILNYNMVARTGAISADYAVVRQDGRPYYRITMAVVPALGEMFAARRPGARQEKKSDPAVTAVRIPTAATHLISCDDFTPYEMSYYDRDAALVSRTTRRQLVLDGIRDAEPFSIPADYTQFHPVSEEEFARLVSRTTLLIRLKNHKKEMSK